MVEVVVDSALSDSCALGASGLDAAPEPRAAQLSDELAQLEAELREMEARLGVQVPASPAQGSEKEAARAVVTTQREAANLDLVCDETEEEKEDALGPAHEDADEEREEEDAADATEAAADLDLAVDPELEALLLRYRGPPSSSASTSPKGAEPTTGRAALAMLGEREAELEREVRQLQLELSGGGGGSSSPERASARPPRLETIQEEAADVTWDYTPQSVAAVDMSLQEDHEEELRHGLDDSTSALALDLAALDKDAEEEAAETSPSGTVQSVQNRIDDDPESDCTSAIGEEQVLKCPRDFASFAGLSSPPPLPPLPSESMSPSHISSGSQTPGREVGHAMDAEVKEDRLSPGSAHADRSSSPLPSMHESRISCEADTDSAFEHKQQLEVPRCEASGLSLDLAQHGVLDTLDAHECAAYLSPHLVQNQALDDLVADKTADMDKTAGRQISDALETELSNEKSAVEEAGRASGLEVSDTLYFELGTPKCAAASKGAESHLAPALGTFDTTGCELGIEKCAAISKSQVRDEMHMQSDDEGQVRDEESGLEFDPDSAAMSKAAQSLGISGTLYFELCTPKNAAASETGECRIVPGLGISDTLDSELSTGNCAANSEAEEFRVAPGRGISDTLDSEDLAQHGVLDTLDVEDCAKHLSPQPSPNGALDALGTKKCTAAALLREVHRPPALDALDSISVAGSTSPVESQNSRLSQDLVQHGVLDTLDVEECALHLSPNHTLDVEECAIHLSPHRLQDGVWDDLDAEELQTQRSFDLVPNLGLEALCASPAKSEHGLLSQDLVQHGVLDTLDVEECAVQLSPHPLSNQFPDALESAESETLAQPREAHRPPELGDLDALSNADTTSPASGGSRLSPELVQHGVLDTLDVEECALHLSPHPVPHEEAHLSPNLLQHGVLDTLDVEQCAVHLSPHLPSEGVLHATDAEESGSQAPRNEAHRSQDVVTSVGFDVSSSEACASSSKLHESLRSPHLVQHGVLDTLDEEACAACLSPQPVRSMSLEHTKVDMQEGAEESQLFSKSAEVDVVGTEEHAAPHLVQNRVIGTVESEEAAFSDFEEECGAAAAPEPQEGGMRAEASSADAAAPQLGELLSRFQVPVNAESSEPHMMSSFKEEDAKDVEHAPLSPKPLASPCQVLRSAPAETFDLRAAIPSVLSADCNEAGSAKLADPFDVVGATVSEPGQQSQSVGMHTTPGSLLAQEFGIDLDGPSVGAVPPALDDGEATCQTCRTKYIADSRFCRMCGQKREFPSESAVQSPLDKPRPFESGSCTDRSKEQSASRTSEVRPQHQRSSKFLKNVFALNVDEPAAMNIPGPQPRPLQCLSASASDSNVVQPENPQPIVNRGECQGIHGIFSVSSTSAETSKVMPEPVVTFDPAPQFHERPSQPQENPIEQGRGLYGNVHQQYDEQRRQKKREKQEKQDRLKREEKLKKQERLARLGLAAPVPRGLKEKSPISYSTHSLGRSAVVQEATENMAEKHGLERHTASSASKVTLPPLVGDRRFESIDMVPEDGEGAVAFQGVRVKLPMMTQPASKRDRSTELPTRTMQQSRGAASSSSAPSLGRQHGGRLSSSYTSSRPTLESIEKQKARLANKMELLSVFHSYHNKVENMSADQLQSLLKQLHGSKDAEESPSRGMKVQRRLRQIDRVCNGLF